MNTQRIWRIGLTGGIGSGKSTVAGLLARHGAAVIDAASVDAYRTHYRAFVRHLDAIAPLYRA